MTNKYEPFVLTIHNNQDDVNLIETMEVSYDTNNPLSASCMLGMAINEFLLDSGNVEKMMKRVVSKLEMVAQNDDKGNVH